MNMSYSSINFNIIFILSGIILVSRTRSVRCNPITNSNLNENIREFSLNEDQTNTTQVRTLQSKGYVNANFGPIHKPVRFKDISDNAVASTSHGRGYSHHEYEGHGHDFEEVPYYGYGHEYHVPDYEHSYHHGFYDHHHGHDVHHVGHHHKHYNHALAAKAVLWPIAGLALLGAAAALVSNPVLLQLGVATGKRKRRDTEEIADTDLDLPWTENIAEENSQQSTSCKDLLQKFTNKIKKIRSSSKTKGSVLKRNTIDKIDKNYVKIASNTT